MRRITCASARQPPETAIIGYPTDDEARAVSPMTPLCCPPDHTEPVPLAHLLRLGGRVPFSTELTGPTTDDNGAHVTFADGTTVDARFVVGARPSPDRVVRRTA